MIFKLFKYLSTAKTVYERVLKPVYEELRRDAYANEPTTTKSKKKINDADDKKPKRSNRRKKDS